MYNLFFAHISNSRNLIVSYTSKLTITFGCFSSSIPKWILQSSNPKFYISSATALKIKFQILCWNCPNRTYPLHRTAFSKRCSASWTHCLGLPAGQFSRAFFALLATVPAHPAHPNRQPSQTTTKAQTCLIRAILDQNRHPLFFVFCGGFQPTKPASPKAQTLKIWAFFAPLPTVPAHQIIPNLKTPLN